MVVAPGGAVLASFYGCTVVWWRSSVVLWLHGSVMHSSVVLLLYGGAVV